MAYSQSFTNDEVRNRILKVYAKFVSDVEPDRLFDWLVQENVITIDQKKRMRHENPIASDRCRAILDHLFSIQHARAFLVVREALSKDNHYLIQDIDNQEPEPGIRVQPEEQSVLHAKIQELEKDLMRYRSVNTQLRDNEDEPKQLVKSELQSEKGESKREKTSQEIVLAEQSNEAALLRKEVQDERRDKESLRSTNEQLRIDTNNVIEANKEHKMTIKTLKNSVEKLEQELSRVKQDKLRYVSDPVLIQIIKTKSAEDERKAILGLTILDKELFVVKRESSEVEVYDSIKLSFRRRWNLKELICPFDLGSCNRNKCLYIMHYKGDGQSKGILRVDPEGKLIKKWSTGNIRGRLSITDESNVILADYYNTSTLIEYSPEGRLIHEINLSADEGIRFPLHAIKLSNDLCVVGHGYYGDGGDRQRVCLVDADGKLKKSFGGERGSTIGHLNGPLYLAVDRNGFIMVADSLNNRVILLDSNLEFRREIIAKEEHGLRHPSRILLNESNGRMFVADNGWNSEEEKFIDGRILIFDFK